MRKIKLLFIFLVLLLVTGCTTEYNLTINNDYSVEENIISYEDDSYYYMFDISKEEVVRNAFNRDLSARKYDFETYEKNNVYGANLKLQYKNINEYKDNNKNFEILFDKLDIIKEDKNVTIHAYELKKYLPTSQRKYFVEDCIVSIKLPTKAISSNADSIDEDNHIYKWYITSNSEDVDINIKYEENEFIKLLNSNYLIIAIGVIVGIVFLVLVTKFIMISKKNNEI